MRAHVEFTGQLVDQYDIEQDSNLKILEFRTTGGMFLKVLLDLEQYSSNFVVQGKSLQIGSAWHVILEQIISPELQLNTLNFKKAIEVRKAEQRPTKPTEATSEEDSANSAAETKPNSTSEHTGESSTSNMDSQSNEGKSEAPSTNEVPTKSQSVNNSQVASQSASEEKESASETENQGLVDRQTLIDEGIEPIELDPNAHEDSLEDLNLSVEDYAPVLPESNQAISPDTLTDDTRFRTLNSYNNFDLSDASQRDQEHKQETEMDLGSKDDVTEDYETAEKEESQDEEGLDL